MDILDYLEQISTNVLLLPTCIIFTVAIILTFKTRFIQLRGIGKMVKLLMTPPTKAEKSGKETINPRQALFTAMSTTIGLATIVSPVVAIKLGGPGALFFFLLTNLFGSVLSFSEVTFAVAYRKKLSNGKVEGGPMQYIKEVLPRFFSAWYAIFTVILLLLWSSSQANTLADLMVNYNVPTWVSGAVLSVFVMVVLVGGIKRIGNVSEKLVPFMFFIYAVSGLYIIFMNLSGVPAALELVFRSALKPKAILGGTAVGSIMQAFRWGTLKGMNSNEAGIGTATIPHSMAETKDPTMQGILSMASIYSHGMLCLISGLIVLLTGTWQDPNVRFGISAMTQSFSMYFSYMGPIILTISSLLFGFGTILGNSYNGSQCYLYMTNNKYMNVYNAAIAILIFVGAVAPVRCMWVIPDFFLVLVALPNIIGILVLSFKHKELLGMK